MPSRFLSARITLTLYEWVALMFSFPAQVLLAGVLIAGSALTLANDADTAHQSSLSDFYNLSLAELGQIEISIATGNSTPLDKAPATASVIYAAEIEAMGARTLDDVLETVPGVHVSLSPLSRLDSIYSIRGIHTGLNPHVLLLMNGIPVQFSSQGGRPILFRLPVNSIDRIEVIRGPGSAIYGADAYSGVINVITKDAAAIDGTEIGARLGSFKSRDLWLQSATSWKDWGVAFSLAHQESAGDHHRIVEADLQSELDSSLGTQASRAPGALSTRYQVLDTRLALNSERMQINLWAWLSTDAGVGAGGAQALDSEGRDDSKLFLTDITYDLPRWSTQWNHSARFSYLYYDEKARYTLFPPGTLLPIGDDGNLNFDNPAGLVQFPDGLRGNPGGVARDTQFDFISIFSGWNSHQLRFAVGAKQQKGTARESKNFGPGVIDGMQPIIDGSLTDVTNTSFVFLEDSSRTIHYASIQDEWKLTNDLIATAGIRYDNYSDFGDTKNPRIALVWAASENLTTKVLYGSAFRAPSFSEQRFKNNPVSIGNPDLRPERIDTQELSFNYRVNSNLQTTLTLFKYHASDMIEFIPDEGDAPTSTAQNARDQDGDGLELEINWKPTPHLRLSSNYSWQDAKDSQTKMAIADAPGQQFMINTFWEFKPNWFLNSQLNWVGERRRFARDFRSEISDYTLLNLTLKRNNIFPNVDVTLALRNLTNEDAREPSSASIPDDYPLESRSGWLEINYTLK